MHEDGASPISYAATSIMPYGNIDKIVTTEEQNIVTFKENNVYTVATFEKDNNILSIKSMNEKPIVIIMDQSSNLPLANEDPNFIVSEENIIDEFDPIPIDARITTTTENTFANYEYTITHSSPEKWQIRKPKGDSVLIKESKNLTYNSTTKGNLNSFKSQVDKINKLEFQAFGSN